MEALITFNWYRCDTKPNLEIADYAVIAAKASGDQRFIASAVWCLGLTYFRLGIRDTSYNHMQEAYQLFITLPPGDVESQRLGGLCGIDLVENARFILQDDEVVSLARDVEKKCTALSDDVVHGSSLLKLGIALNAVRQPQEALFYMDRARTAFKAVGHTHNLARAYHVISWVHLKEHRLSDALDAIEEAWKYAELAASRHVQLNISLTFGSILFITNRDTEAWKCIEISLINASYIGDRVRTARALAYMGYGYLRRGDYQNAYGAYEASTEKAFDSRFVNLKLCKENMDRIKRKQLNPDEVIGFHRPAWDCDKTLFYPPHSNICE
jgi:tetratricopeptide (TPR) repeat protein